MSNESAYVSVAHAPGSDVVRHRAGHQLPGPGERAVMLTEGSTGCRVIGNTVTGHLRPFEIDPKPEPGLRKSGNTSR